LEKEGRIGVGGEESGGPKARGEEEEKNKVGKVRTRHI
jgi:hypothetical protein